MRKLFAMAVLLCTGILSAQNFSCGTVYTPPTSDGRGLPATPPAIDPNKKYVINIFSSFKQYRWNQLNWSILGVAANHECRQGIERYL